jgi:hypothetical protein
MIKIAAVKKNALGSRLIRWGLGEDASHLILHFTQADMVMHFYGGGVHFESLAKVYDEHGYLDSAAIMIGVQNECEFVKRMIKYLVGVKYDVHGFAYFTWAAIKRKLFGIELPRCNAYQRDYANICTEILYAFFDVYAETQGISYPIAKDFGMATPIDCVRACKELLCPIVYSPSPWPWPPLPRAERTNTQSHSQQQT